MPLASCSFPSTSMPKEDGPSMGPLSPSSLHREDDSFGVELIRVNSVRTCSLSRTLRDRRLSIWLVFIEFPILHLFQPLWDSLHLRWHAVHVRPQTLQEACCPPSDPARSLLSALRSCKKLVTWVWNQQGSKYGLETDSLRPSLMNYEKLSSKTRRWASWGKGRQWQASQMLLLFQHMSFAQKAAHDLTTSQNSLQNVSCRV